MNQIHNKKYLVSVLKVLLNINDLEIMKYTIESLIEDIEDSDISDNTASLNNERPTEDGPHE